MMDAGKVPRAGRRLAGAAVAMTLLWCVGEAAGQARVGPPRGKPVAVRSRPGEVPKFEGNPLRHVGDFPGFNVVWQADGRVTDVRAVFPHPLMSRRVVLVTGGGLVLSDDTGKTWQELPGTSAAAIGAVRHVEFAVDGSDALYLASASKGVWRMADLAKPPEQIGSKANGLVSDSTAQMRVDFGDPLCRALVVVYGADAPGASRSEDGGKTWAPLPNWGEYYIDQLVGGGPGVPWAFVVAGQRDPAGVRGVYFCQCVGDFLKDYARETDPVDGAVEMHFAKPFQEMSDISYWATRGSGLMKTGHEGTHTERVGPAEVDRWASVGVTYGATADARVIYAYEPAKLGMAVSEDDGQTFTSFNRGHGGEAAGLPTGRFVKEGVRVRANAGGGVFYAAVNNALYVGQRYTGAFAIGDVDVSPGAVRFAHGGYGEALGRFREELAKFRDERGAAAARVGAVMGAYGRLRGAVSEVAFTVKARVAPTEEAGDGGGGHPASVSVDLSRAGASARTPMYDDGMHGDGAAGDGVYAVTSIVRPDRLSNHYQDWRRPWPGPTGLTITAVGRDGSLSSAVGVLGLLSRPESRVFWAPNDRDTFKDLEGGVEAALDGDGAAGGRRSLKLSPTDKPWSVPLSTTYDRNALGYYALSFEVKGDAQAPGELYVQLRDASPDTAAASTARVPVTKEGLVDGGKIDGTFRRVVVPFARLMRDGPAEGAGRFRPMLLKAVVISGDGGEGQHYWIGPVRFHVTAEELADEAKGGAAK